MNTLDYFSVLVADDRSFPLTETSVALGQVEHAWLDIEAVQDQIDRLVMRLRECLPSDAAPLARLRALQRYFFGELGLRGRSEQDHERVPVGACHLHEVLRDRQGHAVAVGILYLEMARQLGLNAQGALFPHHLLVRVSLPLGEVVIDPVDGRSLSHQMMMELLEPRQRRHDMLPELALEPFLRVARPREIVARLLRQLELRYQKAEDWDRLLGVQQRLVMLLPYDHGQRRDRGLTLARLGRDDEAILDLSDYLSEAHPRAADRSHVAAKLRRLQSGARSRWH